MFLDLPFSRFLGCSKNFPGRWQRCKAIFRFLRAHNVFSKAARQERAGLEAHFVLKLGHWATGSGMLFAKDFACC
jgi:hypothetical protein